MLQSTTCGIKVSSRSKSIKMGCALAPKSRHDLLQLPSGTRVRHETRGDATVFLRDGENRLHLVFDTGEVIHATGCVCVTVLQYHRYGALSLQKLTYLGEGEPS